MGWILIGNSLANVEVLHKTNKTLLVSFRYVETMTKWRVSVDDSTWFFFASRNKNIYTTYKFDFLQELSSVLKSRGLLLTAAISADKATIDAAYDIPEISKYLDFIHLMAYDYHGAWDKKVLPNAPLKCNDGLCVVNIQSESDFLTGFSGIRILWSFSLNAMILLGRKRV